MGRCINWEIHSPQTVTADQKRQIEALNQEMNAPDIKWTCENFWTTLDHITDEGKAFNFTKTAGNEWNTHLCVEGIIKLSRIIPEHLIEVTDEGEYLYCPLLIKNGQAQPDLKALKSDIGRWLIELNKGEKSPYKDMALGYLQKALKQYQDVESLLDQTQPFKWYPVLLFCREVKIEDFAEYPEYGPTGIMAGFEGEYWGLSDKDSQQESLKMLSQVTDLLEKAGFSKDQIKVAPKINIEKNK